MRPAVAVAMALFFATGTPSMASATPQSEKPIVKERPRSVPHPLKRGARIDLSGRGLTDAAFAKLLADGAIPDNANHIDLSGNRLTAASLAALGQRKLAVLTGLVLDGNPVGDGGARALAEATGLRGVRHLSVARTGLTGTGVATLVSGLHLTSLGLDGNTIGADGFAALAAQTNGWTTLSLRETGMTSLEVTILASSGVLESCTWLDVAGNGLDQAAVDALWKPVSLVNGTVVSE